MRGPVSDERRIPTRANRAMQASRQTGGSLHRKAAAGFGGRIRGAPLRIGKRLSSVAGIAASEAGRAEPKLTVISPQPSTLQCVGWVEPFAKPISSQNEIDGYRFAPPILRSIGWLDVLRIGSSSDPKRWSPRVCIIQNLALEFCGKSHLEDKASEDRDPTAATSPRPLLYTSGCGRIERPAFSAPPDFRKAERCWHNSRENPRRGRERVIAVSILYQMQSLRTTRHVRRRRLGERRDP
jgi:hypothetical protein